MPEALDPTELLAGANPVAAYEIDPARLDSMISRVTATALPRRLTLWRAWQMRAGSALAAAAVVVTAVVISLGSAPQGLTVLALNGATPVAGAASQPLATSGLTFAAAQATVPSAATPAPKDLSAGRALATNTGSADVFQFVSIPAPSTALKRLAVDLGVLDAASSPTCPWRTVGTNATLSGQWSPASLCRSTAPSLAAPITWSFAMRNPTCPPSTSTTAGDTTSVCPSVQNVTLSGATARQLLTWSAPVLKRLVTHGLIVSGATLGAAITNRFDNTVYFPIEVNGATLANRYERFQFTSYGLLIHASGLLGRTSLVDSYPLISQAAGVSLLEGTHASSTKAINPGGPMIPAPSTTTTPSTQVVKAALFQYEQATLTNGSVVLVPQYLYLTNRGARYQVLALSPSYFTDRAAK